MIGRSVKLAVNRVINVLETAGFCMIRDLDRLAQVPQDLCNLEVPFAQGTKI
jgi:hypothetical protein